MKSGAVTAIDTTTTTPPTPGSTTHTTMIIPTIKTNGIAQALTIEDLSVLKDLSCLLLLLTNRGAGSSKRICFN